jgi:hypothetical protein
VLLSELRPTPVDRNLKAGRERRVEREEEDGLRDLLRRPEALHRDDAECVFPHVGPHLLRGKHLFEDARLDGTGRHRVDADVLEKELGCEHAGERPQRSLGGSVSGLARQSLDVGD